MGGFNVLSRFEENLAATHKPEYEMRFYERPLFAPQSQQQAVCTIIIFGCDGLDSAAQRSILPSKYLYAGRFNAQFFCFDSRANS
jgi:hypothetical protein